MWFVLCGVERFAFLHSFQELSRKVNLDGKYSTSLASVYTCVAQAAILIGYHSGGVVSSVSYTLCKTSETTASQTVLLRSGETTASQTVLLRSGETTASQTVLLRSGETTASQTVLL